MLVRAFTPDSNVATVNYYGYAYSINRLYALAIADNWECYA